MRYTYVQRSLVWSALSFPVGILCGKVVEVILKSINPDHVDITAGLAYLAHILIATAVGLLACWLMAVINMWRARRKTEEANQVGLAAAVLIAVIVLTILTVVINGVTNHKIEQTKELQHTNQGY